MPENNNTQSEKTSSEIDVCSSYLKADIIAMINQDDGTEVRTAKPYGIGIDTAKDFIDVTVMVTIKEKCIAFYRRFDTDWNSLLQAKQWAVGTISIKSDPHIDMFDKNGNVSDTFHYCIESTGNYHKAILYAWNGMPSVVNPSIAGAAKKKTDRLDSRLLSIHDMTGIWNSSFIPSLEVEELRALIAEREYFSKMITRISARINNILLRFGFTVGRDGSVTKDSKIRNLVEQLISDNPDTTDMNICTNEIPEQVRSIIRELYNDYDRYAENEEAFNAAIIDKVKSMYWETDTGVLKGDEMLAILTTAPGIGEKTACLWLAQIVTPRRFPSANAVSAYCGTDPSLKISADKVVSTKKEVEIPICIMLYALLQVF